MAKKDGLLILGWNLPMGKYVVDEIEFYVPFYSISVLLGKWRDDYERTLFVL